MKRATLLLSFLSLLCCGMLRAQNRYTDLDVAMRGFKNGDTIFINDPVDLKVRIWNLGNDTLVHTDTMQLYMTINGNSIIFYDPSTMMQSPFSPFPGYNLSPDDSDFVMFNNFIFGQGYTPGPLSICMKVMPVNAADSVTDTITSNNESCLNLILAEKPTSIDREMLSTGVNVFPNPAHSNATLSFTLNEASSITLELSDMTGRVIRKNSWSGLGAGSHSLDIDMNGIAPGMYMYRLSSGASQYTGRIAIE